MTAHGHTRLDHYHWLHDPQNPDVIAYLEAENAYADAMLAHTKELQQQLYTEMTSRLPQVDDSVPVKIGDYYYYSRIEDGQQYPIYCRKQGSLDAADTVLLDLNAEVVGHVYMRLSSYKISPDHTLLAYSLDRTGAEAFTVYVKDVTTGELLPDCIPNVSYSVEWGHDHQTLFYTIADHTKRPYKLMRHLVGTDPAEDVELFCEPDERFRLTLDKTKDQAYVVMYVFSIETWEAYTLSTANPEQGFQIVQARQPGLRYRLEHRQGMYYILTNDNAPHYQVMTTPVANPSRAHWQPFVAQQDDVTIEAMDMFAEYLALYERAEGRKALRIIHLDSGDTHTIDFPESVYTIAPDSNPDFHSRDLRFTYASLTTPNTVYEYNMATRARTIRKQEAVLGGFRAEAYQSERLWATAPDGTRVPMSLVYKQGLVRDGTQPCLLYAYGAYGFSTEPQFHSHLLSLLDRGFVYAIAHVRGGQELGRQWYEQGKLLYKHNTFTDFIACAEALLAGQYTCREKLAILGRSAGGLLIGAVLNQMPSLAHVAIAEVPFVDAVTTMLNAALPLTVREYEEWGDPNDKLYYDAILSYSPYDNVAAKEYPHLLITAGLHDARVQYWEPAKWAAKLRAMKTGDKRLLLITNMDAGHSGASGRYEMLQEIALHYAFLLDTLEITAVPAPKEAQPDSQTASPSSECALTDDPV
jgi:oligopeptidase B